MAELVSGKTGDWEMVIGLEVHAQVTSKSKLFSGAPDRFRRRTEHASVAGRRRHARHAAGAERFRRRTGGEDRLGLNAQVNKRSVFERKNYFYPDLPQGYQISQFLHPIVGKGEVEVDLPDGSTKVIGVTRLHLEQDAGKSLHDQDPKRTFVDLNRSGVALMEIVSEPDMRSADEAAAYVRKLRAILRYLGTCDGNMDEGSMRCDVNLSMRRPGAPLGTRCEIKNVNSIRFVMAAIEYEARRQVEILEEGGKIDQETRLWDTRQGVTRSMRSKEEAHDYRYFPDPDLLPLVLEDGLIERIKATLPELPDAKKHRFMGEWGLSPYDASVLVAEQERAAFYEEVAKGRDPKLAANWTITELLGALNREGKDLADSPVSASKLGGLIDLISDNTISGRIAKEVFAEMVESGKDAASIVEEKGLRQVVDTGAIDKLVDEVMAANQDKVAEYRSGKDKLFGFFVGQAMKASGGKANPALLNDTLKKKLAP